MTIRQFRLLTLAVASVLVTQGTASAQWRLFRSGGQDSIPRQIDRENGSISIFDADRHAASLFGKRSAVRLVNAEAADLGAPPAREQADASADPYGAVSVDPGYCDPGYCGPGGCGPGGCGPGGCGPAGCQTCGVGACCPQFWEHRSGGYVEWMHLTARGADVRYATPVDALGAGQVPIGGISTVDHDYDSGYRVGLFYALDSCSSITLNYARWEGDASDSVALAGGTGFLRAELVHPNTVNVAADSLTATADYDIEFEMYDINYKGLIFGGCNYSLNYLVGFRHGRLDQDVLATYLITGTTTLQTDVEFEGWGPRVGFEGERLIGGRGFFAFTRGSATLLAGEFDADYVQTNVFAGTQATTGVEDDRIVPVLEYELGVGWQNQCGNVRLMAGYYVAGWFNTMTTPALVRSVQGNDFHDDDETLTFDGLTARAEFRF